MGTQAAYQSNNNSLNVNKTFYKNLAESKDRELVEEFVIPIRSGKAWQVPSAHICTIGIVSGIIIKMHYSFCLIVS